MENHGISSKFYTEGGKYVQPTNYQEYTSVQIAALTGMSKDEVVYDTDLKLYFKYTGSLWIPAKQYPIITDTDVTTGAFAKDIIYFNSDKQKLVFKDNSNWHEIITSLIWDVLLSFDFEDGNIPTMFNIVNDTNNKWLIMPPANLGLAGNDSDYCLAISNDNGVTGNYSNNNISHIWFDFAVPTGISKWRMSSIWAGVAESTYDYIYVSQVPTSYTPVAGSNIPTGSGYKRLGNERYNEQSVWLKNEIEFDNSDSGNTVRIVITFRSDGSVINNPAGGFDNFLIETLK